MDNIAAVDLLSPEMEQKAKHLIAFNKFKKITFFGTCKVEINKTDKCLIFRTNATEKKFQEFASTFQRIFVQKENALCIIDAISNKDFIVIFPLKSTCDRIIEEINKVKFPSGPPTADPVIDDHLFKNNFYIPILKEIQVTVSGYNEIKAVLLDLVNKFEPDQRQTYMNMVFELLLSSTDASIIDSSFNGTVAEENEKARVVENDETFDDSFSSSVDNSLNETTSSSNRNYSFRKRPAIIFPTYNFASSNFSDHESNIGSSAPKKSRKSSAADDGQMNQTLDAIHASCETITASYEFVECFRQNALRKRILIFTSDDKDHCYEFYFCTGNRGWHNCKNCSKMNQRATCMIKIISIENGKMEFKLGKHPHICEPIKYLSGNYNIKELPQDVLKLANKQEKYVTPKRIIQKQNFKIEKIPHQTRSKVFVKMLTICDPVYDNQKFLYYFHQNKQKFSCKDCAKKGKHVSAKLVKDENEEECIELSAVKHVCL